MAKTFDEVVYSLCKKYTNQSQLGFKSVKQVANGFEIEYVNGTKATYTVQNMHQHTNMAILNVLNKDADGDLTFNGKKITNLTADQEQLLMKFSLSANNKLLFDGKPIEGGSSGGAGAPYDDTVVRGLIDTNKANIATNTSDISELTTRIGTTYDELTTAIGAKANTTDLTTHTDDTDIHITTTERTKWNEVVNKANKTEVLLQDKIQTTTGTETHDNVYSAKLTKTELDLKANDDEVVKKTDIVTTINSTSTNDKVAGAKAVHDSLANKLDKTVILTTADEVNSFDREYQSFIIEPTVAEAVGLSKVPDSTWFCINLSHFKGFKYPSQIAFEYAGIERIMYRTAHNGVWHDWKRVCTTSVADVGITTISSSNSDITFGSNSCYSVVNGICYVTIWEFKGLTVCRDVAVATGMPKPKQITGTSLINAVGSGDNIAFIYVDNSNSLCVNNFIPNVYGYGSFSYPVAE